MTKLQILFLFTSSKKLSTEESEVIKNIAAEEYCRKFGRSFSDVFVSIDDASANVKNDIIIAIDSDTHVLNEGVMNAGFINNVSSRFSLNPALRRLGFSGRVGMKIGLVNANDKSAKELDNNSSGKDNIGAGNREKTLDAIEDYKKLAQNYVAVEPKYSFDMLEVPQSTIDRIEQALGRIKYEREVFEEWGLYSIMSNPVTAMSFYGPPGTGKSLAAEAIADKLGKKIIRASYTDIESRYVGAGPKNVSAIFYAAEEQDALLFIDEADSMLSKRLTNVADGSAQSMNSMRSQLLISLENYHGIVIFATNLAVNYDRAFVSRLINIKFDFPDVETRKGIWEKHLYPRQSGKHRLAIPLDKDVDLDRLANEFSICGRDIRNAVVDACVEARRRGLSVVNYDCLAAACKAIEASQKDVVNAKDETVLKQNIPDDVRKQLAAKLQEEVDKAKTVKIPESDS